MQLHFAIAKFVSILAAIFYYKYSNVLRLSGKILLTAFYLCSIVLYTSDSIEDPLSPEYFRT